MGKENIKKIQNLMNLECGDVFSVLGIHYINETKRQGLVVRLFLPRIEQAFVIDRKTSKKHKMVQTDERGFFEIEFKRRKKFFDYKFEVINFEGHSWQFDDPYHFLPIMGEIDLHLLSEGNHYKSYEILGAHTKEVNKITGVYFAVWAPNAKMVSVVGNFNHWDGRIHQMRNMNGFWEIFIPGLIEGELYKYEIKTQNNQTLLKQDPYSFFIESAPKTASIVYNSDKHNWKDELWMKTRKEKNALNAPISIYELHIGSWKRGENNRYLSYREIADPLVEYIKSMGYTHIELLPIAEHPFFASWGYQVTGYFAPTSRYGNPEDFAYFVDIMHQNDIGVILDWVPAHFPKDEHALSLFDGTALYEHSDPRLGEHKDWGTKIFNFGRYEVRNFLISNALFWLDKYHIDGLRVDAVASMLYLDYSRNEGEWIPNKFGGRENIEAIEFLKRLNETVYMQFSDIVTIAEESTSWPSVSKPIYAGGLGFGYKWNMGWMHDILDYMKQDSIYRKYNQGSLTFSLWYAFSENFVLALSHDEVVHGKGSLIEKMSGDTWQKMANLRLLYTYMFTHPGKKLTFMGMDIAQWREWNHDRELDWYQLEEERYRKFNYFVKDLHRVYKENPSLFEVDFSHDGFQWIDFNDSDNSIVSYIRKGKDEDNYTITILNFTPVVRDSYKIGVPENCEYEIIFNSDSEYYGGSNIGAPLPLKPVKMFWQENPYAIELTLPPLGALILKPIK